MGRHDADTNVGRRLQSRVRARLFANLVTHQHLHNVYIDSLSSDGAGLSLEAPPPAGSDVVLSWEAYDMPGTVVWTKGRRCGLSFTGSVPADVVSAIGKRTSGERYVRDLPRPAGLRKHG